MNLLRFIAETLANGMETNATLTLSIQTTILVRTDGMALDVTIVVHLAVLHVQVMMLMTVCPAMIMHTGIDVDASVIKVSLELSVKLPVMIRPLWLTLTLHMMPIQATTPTHLDMELMMISTDTSTAVIQVHPQAMDIAMVTVVTAMDPPIEIVYLVQTTPTRTVMDTVDVTNTGLVMIVLSTEAHVTQVATRQVGVPDQQPATAQAASLMHLAMLTENVYVTHTGQDMTVASISDSVIVIVMDVTEPLMKTVTNARTTPTWMTTAVAHATLTGAETTVEATLELVNLIAQAVKDQKIPTVNIAPATLPGTDMDVVYVMPTGLDQTVAYM
jgi:hypothetical protein